MGRKEEKRGDREKRGIDNETGERKRDRKRERGLEREREHVLNILHSNKKYFHLLIR